MTFSILLPHLKHLACHRCIRLNFQFRRLFSHPSKKRRFLQLRTGNRLLLWLLLYLSLLVLALNFCSYFLSLGRHLLVRSEHKIQTFIYKRRLFDLRVPLKGRKVNLAFIPEGATVLTLYKASACTSSEYRGHDIWALFIIQVEEVQGKVRVFISRNVYSFQ